MRERMAIGPRIIARRYERTSVRYLRRILVWVDPSLYCATLTALLRTGHITKRAMPEALTESFCERCGTRYEFTAPTRLNPLRKTRGLVSGLKNYIMSQDALGDALGDAMRSEQDTLAAAQLEAFHTSFNFCIDCRQYSCLNCWNDDAGRCRSCAPIRGTDDLAERIGAGLALPTTALPTNGVTPAELNNDGIGRHLGVEAWPTADLDEVLSDVAWPSEEMPAAPEAAPLIEPEPALEPMVMAEPEPVVEPIVALEPEPRFELDEEPEPVVATNESEPDAETMPVLGWDTDDTFELIHFPTPVVEEPPSIEFAAAPELATEEQAWIYDDEAFAAEAPTALTWAAAPDLSGVEPEPELGRSAPAAFEEPTTAPPVTPAPPPASIEARPAARRRRATDPADRVAASSAPIEAPEADDPMVAARRAQLDMLGLGDPGSGVLSDRTQPLPYRSSGASVHPAELAARLAAQQQGTQSPAQTIRASMWDASAREVAGAPSPIGVQNCGGCGLSLSATARFCRRCGTRQAQSA